MVMHGCAASNQHFYKDSVHGGSQIFFGILSRKFPHACFLGGFCLEFVRRIRQESELNKSFGERTSPEPPHPLFHLSCPSVCPCNLSRVGSATGTFLKAPRVAAQSPQTSFEAKKKMAGRTFSLALRTPPPATEPRDGPTRKLPPKYRKKYPRAARNTPKCSFFSRGLEEGVENVRKNKTKKNVSINVREIFVNLRKFGGKS